MPSGTAVVGRHAPTWADDATVIEVEGRKAGFNLKLLKIVKKRLRVVSVRKGAQSLVARDSIIFPVVPGSHGCFHLGFGGQPMYGQLGPSALQHGTHRCSPSVL